MPTPDFSTLEGIFSAWTPADLVGTVTPNLGGVGAIPGVPNAAGNATAFQLLLEILQNNGRGVYTAADLVKKFNDLVSGDASLKGQGIDISQFLDFYSTQGFIDQLGPNVDNSKSYQGPTGTKLQISGLQEIIGKDFQIPAGNTTPLDVTLVCSRSPFFSPMTRGTHTAEVFLNAMPSIILQQLVPYLQVEFQLTRTAAANLQAPGLLKFLLGAPPIKANSTDATDLVIAGRQVGSDGNEEVDFAGMEMFTSPQTLFNPLPNTANGTGTSGRYADVVDPTRPFGSIKSLTVQANPAGAGFYVYKKAALQIVIHDRARLSEVSDFLRPRVYSGATVWLTYGWRAPDRPSSNPYFDYINNNMLLREAYHITNISMTFDQVGQVNLTLDLWTKGVNEMRQSKISDNVNSLDYQFKQMRELGEKIAQLRQDLHLDQQSGANKEMRPFMVLDAAEQGTYPPNLSSKKDIKDAIDTLWQTLRHTAGVDQDKVNQLITNLHKFADSFTTQDPVTGKMTLTDQVQTRVTKTIADMFTEITTGADPFTLTGVKGKCPGMYGDKLATLLDSFQKAPPKEPVLGLKRNVVVSFGKLFTVFALRNIISADTAHELQVFFYPLNDSCGPVSGLSVAQFPIDLPMFLDQYREYVIRNGGEKITLEDFLAMVVNAQFLDPRALGYGMRKAYAPFDPKDPDAKKPDKQDVQGAALDAWGKEYGAFKQPAIEMLIEVSHPRVSDVGQSDVLASINSSASADLNTQKTQQNNIKQIMRIHLYDKQVNPYKTAGKMLANVDGTTAARFYQADPPKSADTSTSTDNFSQEASNITKTMGGPNTIPITVDSDIGKAMMLSSTSNQRIKDAVSKTVPTIRFGSNGTTIIAANLGSKADPKVTAVNMQRSMTIRNMAAPNGSGEFGLPLRVIPAKLDMTTFGNPLAQMAQVYFIDFQTGTTLDNLYIVTGLTHTITPGKFETTWNFGFSDAYGVFEQAVQNAVNIGSLPPNTSAPGK